MKLHLWSFFVFGLLVQLSSGDNPEEIFHECMQQTKVAPEIVHKVIMHDTAFEDHNGKCFEKCVCVRLGLCDEKDGKLLPEKFIAMKPFLSPDKIREELPKCNEIIGTDECDSIHQRFICFYERVPKDHQVK